MATEHSKAQAQLDLINEVITTTKARFERNGSVFIFWGILLSIASGLQFIFIQLGMNEISYYPYFAIIFGWIYMFRHFSRRKRKPQSSNILTKTLASVWIYAGLNAALLGFLFASILQTYLIPVILIVVGVSILISGVVIRYRYLFFAGILCNMMGYLAFALDFSYQPLLTCIVYIVVMVVPGFMLAKENREKNAA